MTPDEQDGRRPAAPRSLKIAFIGSHGVGKTTLCFDLAGRIKKLDLSVDLVKEVVRDCPLPINQETTLEAQAWILHTQIAREIAAASRFQVVVCDRSVVDNYAYLVHAAGRRETFDPLVRRWVRTYDGLFKVPVGSPPTYDGTRDTSVEFQREIDWTIDRLLSEFEVPAIHLDPRSPEDWHRIVLRQVGLPLEIPQLNLFAEGERREDVPG
jgi:nicotinamide riboside kinase